MLAEFDQDALRARLPLVRAAEETAHDGSIHRIRAFDSLTFPFPTIPVSLRTIPLTESSAKPTSTLIQADRPSSGHGSLPWAFVNA